MCNFVYAVIEFGCRGVYREVKLIKACSKPSDHCKHSHRILSDPSQIIKTLVRCSQGCNKTTNHDVLYPPAEFQALKPNALDREK